MEGSELFTALRELVQFAGSAINVIVASIAIHYWKTWRAEKTKEQNRVEALEDGQASLERAVTSNTKRVDGLELRQREVEKKHERHARKFVRIETVLEALGHKPRLVKDDDSSTDDMKVG